MANRMTIGGYLVKRLEQLGLRHIFGIPGDYVLTFFDLLEASSIQVVGTCTEIGAGYAADAYARVNGLGAVCVTYCVGGLNALNAAAGAYAEKSPIIVISGAPGLDERVHVPMLHHRVSSFDTQLRIYRHVTVAAAALEDPRSVPGIVDEALDACISNKQPIYFELPRDRVLVPCAAPQPRRKGRIESDAKSLDEALEETLERLAAARRPVILAGVEIHRFGLQGELLKLVERSGYPVAATLLGKSVISERHPQYVGVYEGALGRERVRRIVESADVVLVLGAFMTDINLGIYTAKLEPEKTIYARSRRVTIRHHHYEDVFLGHFIRRLAQSRRLPHRARPPAAPATPVDHRVHPSRPLTVRKLFERVNAFLADDNIVICDIGDSLFGGADLEIHRRTEFLSPAYYTSMGFAVPAAIGAQVRNRRLRPVVLVGDGAFQMTGQELSTIARLRLNPIILVLNNKGYTTERYIHEGPYNDIHDWAYHAMPAVLRAGRGWEVHTEGELEAALAGALANRRSFSILNIHLDPLDASAALQRLGKRLSGRGR